MGYKNKGERVASPEGGPIYFKRLFYKPANISNTSNIYAGLGLLTANGIK